MRAIICGGGIAGLTAALCLHQRGWDVKVLEQAPEITEVGAGIQISPNGFKVLEALGLGTAIRHVSYEPDVIEMRMGRSGRRLMSIPMKKIATRRWGAPYLQIHRADLITALRVAVERQIPGAIQTGTSVTSYSQTDRAITVRTTKDIFQGDILIGADGVRSTIQAQMLGKTPARFTGAVAWRAVVPVERLTGLHIPPGACIWAGEGRHAVTYPVRRGRLINFVGIVDQDDWRTESWTETGLKSDARSDFEGWSPLIPALIENADHHFRWALHDRAPLSSWSEGRAVLIGDACHPMLPSLAQGACQAFEDAWVLAKMATGASDFETAFRKFETIRKDRTAKIQAGAAANVRLFHKAGRLAQVSAYTPIALAARFAPGVIHGRNDWIYRHDVTAG